ncbi:MAG: class I adenylate-forming enzyme family protein [Geminicoccaceae bacterium]
MDRPAMACEGDSWTGRVCLARIAARMASLDAGGAKPGERVIVLSGRGNAFWCDMIAVWAVGGVAVPIVASMSAGHIDAVMDRAEPRFIIGRQDQIGEAFSMPRHLDDVGGYSDAGALDRMVDRAPEQTAAILFTSGSTGVPKGVQLAHRALLQNALGTAAMLPTRPDDTLFIAIPFRFVSAVSHFLVTTLTGGCFAGTEQPIMPADLIDHLRAIGATAFGGAPLQLRWIADQLDEAGLDLRWLMSSGDHLSSDIVDKLAATSCNPSVLAVYGLTELAGRFCVLRPELALNKNGSVGLPIPGLDLELRGDDGRPVEVGEIGSVHARGTPVMDGYRQDEAATRAVIDDAGWFETGDFGVLDEDGFLFLRGRRDNVFKTSGLKVSGQLIADALMRTGSFSDVAVFPIEDPIAGHVACAYYCMPPERDLQKGAVLRALRESLPVNHLPARFERLARIPRTASGKIDRAAFREMIKAIAE